MPINLCPICQEEFRGWALYHEHLNLMHGVTHKHEEMPVKVATDIVTLLVTPPKQDLRRREYKPMDPAVKRDIVARFEKKLGAAIIG